MSQEFIDVNVNLARWPFRRLRHEGPVAMVEMLRQHGVKQAWAGSFDGLLHKDVAGVNRRLAEDCQKSGAGILVPFGTVNPTLPDWEEDLRRCHEDLKMPGIRLHPNYHGYKLDDPAFNRLLTLANERSLVVQLVISMEDERTQHPLVRVPHVDISPLFSVLKTLPKLKLVVLNWARSVRGEPLLKLIAAGEVYLDIAMLEGIAGIGNLIKQVPVNRVLFGSHAPLFYHHAAQLKMKESELTEGQASAIASENARRILPAKS